MFKILAAVAAGFVIVFAAYLLGFLFPALDRLMDIIIPYAAMLALGSTLAYIVTALVAMQEVKNIPPPARQIMLASRPRSGEFLVMAIGRDKKVRLVRGRTDGKFIKILDEPYRDRYIFAVDPEAILELHGSSIRTGIFYVDFLFNLAPPVQAAIAKFKEMGYETLGELLDADEAYHLAPEAEKQLKNLKSWLVRIEDPDKLDEEGKKAFAEALKAKQNLERILELNPGDEPKAFVAGVWLKPEDLHGYLVYQLNPAIVRDYAVAEVNRVLALRSEGILESMKKWLPIIIIVTLCFIGILATLSIIGGGARLPNVQVVPKP